MMLDATRHYDQPLTGQRLFAWHASLFPTGRSGMTKIGVGAWRDDRKGPMQVVSGPMGKERSISKRRTQSGQPEKWDHSSTGKEPIDPVLNAGPGHLWFVTIHPFDDGNGRIARAITDMALARSENSPQRFYSMSAQLRQERSAYYDILELTACWTVLKASSRHRNIPRLPSARRTRLTVTFSPWSITVFSFKIPRGAQYELFAGPRPIVAVFQAGFPALTPRSHASESWLYFGQVRKQAEPGINDSRCLEPLPNKMASKAGRSRSPDQAAFRGIMERPT